MLNDKADDPAPFGEGRGLANGQHAMSRERGEHVRTAAPLGLAHEDHLAGAGLSDAFLKPLMIGHGLEVPMPIILVGVIGGVMAYGLVGLFIGAVLLAVGYVLFREWLSAPQPKAKAATDTTLQAAE